jgi:hypothetical protein
MDTAITPISHYLGVDIFTDQFGAKIIIVDDKREQFRLNVHVWNFIYRAQKTNMFVARSGQLVSKASRTINK